jgi:hypothetical protein
MGKMNLKNRKREIEGRKMKNTKKIEGNLLQLVLNSVNSVTKEKNLHQQHLCVLDSSIGLW